MENSLPTSNTFGEIISTTNIHLLENNTVLESIIPISSRQLSILSNDVRESGIQINSSDENDNISEHTLSDSDIENNNSKPKEVLLQTNNAKQKIKKKQNKNRDILKRVSSFSHANKTKKPYRTSKKIELIMFKCLVLIPKIHPIMSKLT